MTGHGTVRVGPAGWSYADWEGPVYPAARPRGFDPLRFLARFFDLVEINSSFYRPPSPAMARSWAERVSGNPRFLFTAKLWRGFTHDRDREHREEEAAFREGLRPLLDARRLACVLVQFPHSFRPSPGALEHIGRLAERFQDFPLVVELRRAGWAGPEPLAWLAERGIAFCNVDQPRIGRGGGATLAPGEVLTAPRAYVRLHGRNREAWFDEAAGRDARYDYLYTPAELEPWIASIRRLSERAEEVHVVTNNHFRGKAVVNALMIRSLLDGEPVEAPPGLLEAYPELAPHARGPAQGRLF